jgi:hypothetical protein
MQNYLAGKTRDPRNLIKACRKQGVKDPRHITQVELQTEFYVCKHNLNILAKHGPYFCRKFLRRLLTSAKQNGDAAQATKIVGILQKEASQKRWRQVNRTTRKAGGGLTVAVKVPIADGGYDKFKTQEGVFQVVSKTLVERFQLALVADCHRGTFLKMWDTL